MKVKKLTITALLIALNVVFSSFIIIPLGPVKTAPVQHFVDILCTVFVGPWCGLAQALASSLIGITFGTGSAFAFPGSMIGMFLANLFYMYRKHIFMAAVGEVIGTGIIGSLMYVPPSWILGLQHFFIKPLMLVFVVPSFLGATISYILLIVLKKRGLLDKFR